MTDCDTCGGPHDRERHREIALAQMQVEEVERAAAGGEAPWWWLSFVDTSIEKTDDVDRFVGVSIVQSHVDGLAPAEAWAKGCNPGGEVRIYPWMADPEGPNAGGPPPEADRNVLMTIPELIERGYIDADTPRD